MYYWLFIFLILYFYGLFFVREVIFTVSIELQLKINAFDIVLSVLSDIYLIIYFLLPIILFIMNYLMFKEFNSISLIRYGSYKKWIYSLQKTFFLHLFTLIIIWIGVALSLTIGLTYENRWSDLASNHMASNYTITPNLESFIQFPLLATILQIVLFGISILLIQFFLLIVFVYFKNKNLIIIISTLVFLGAIVGFKLLPSSFMFFSLPNYLVLYHGLSNFNSTFTLFILIGICGSLLILFAEIIDLKLINLKTYIYMFSPYLIFILLCLSGIIYSANLLNTELITFWDLLIYSFNGISQEGFNYISYIYYIIVFFGFIYLVEIHLQKEFMSISYYKIIRYRSLFRWFFEWISKVIVFSFLFLFILLLLTYIVALIYGYTNIKEINYFENIPIKNYFYQFFINGFLQLTSYSLIVFITSWLSREVFRSFFVVSIMMVLMLPGLYSVYIPVGLNSLGLAINGSDIFHYSILLLISILLELLIILWLLTKRDFII